MRQKLLSATPWSVVLLLCAIVAFHANKLEAATAVELKVSAKTSAANPLRTGIRLTAGQTILIEPNKDDWWTFKHGGRRVDYRGQPGGSPGAAAMVLKWTIGKTSGQVLAGQAIVAREAGELLLHCGDASPRDNGGFIRVVVTGKKGEQIVVPEAKDDPKPVPPPVAAAPPKLIDVAVPSARPDPEAKAPTSMPAGDPNVIERPEYQTKPRRLVKNITSVTAMTVSVASDGTATGLTSDIIAIVPPESRNVDKAGVGFYRLDGDVTMEVAFEEAVRAVTLRYPRWEPGHIDISFGEKFTAHGGPSAGSAFAVLMLSCLEGFEIDPRCAITGDISVDWKVRKVGGVTAKVRGATLDKCLYAAIPEGNAGAFADMALLYGIDSLWSIQVFSMTNLHEAIAVVRTDRPENLARAMQLFAELQPQLAKGQLLTLRSPQTREVLKQILELAPNHLSAKCLLAISNGTAPTTLSANATIYQLSTMFYPYRVLLSSGKKLDRNSLPVHVTVLARKRIAALRPIAQKDLQPLIKEIAAFIEALDGAAMNSVSLSAVTARARAVDAQFAALSADPDFLDKLVREGY